MNMNSKNQEHQIEYKNRLNLTLYPLISPYYLLKVPLPHLQFNLVVGSVGCVGVVRTTILYTLIKKWKTTTNQN